jgi:hypothetical protein
VRSSGYRKIDRLTDAGLLEEGVRVRIGRGHPTEYRRRDHGVAVAAVGLLDGAATAVDVGRATTIAGAALHAVVLLAVLRTKRTRG